MTAAIELRGITQRFGGLVAVDDVSISVEPGRVHGIIGPNGAGKTTLLNILSGLQRPTSGQVVVAGEDVTRWRGHTYVTKARLVRTFQTVRLFSSMTVRENVVVAAQTVAPYAEAQRRVVEVLERLRAHRPCRRAGCLDVLRTAATRRAGAGAGCRAEGGAARRACGGAQPFGTR